MPGEKLEILKFVGVDYLDTVRVSTSGKTPCRAWQTGPIFPPKCMLKWFNGGRLITRALDTFGAQKS